MNDGIDYVPAKAPVLMGHHFSSIAGAGRSPDRSGRYVWLAAGYLWVLDRRYLLRRGP